MFSKKGCLRVLWTGIALLLAGCASTSTLYSNTFAKPAARVTKINVLYIESRLTAKGSGGGVYALYDVGYTDLPELFRERVAIVLELNNIKFDYATFKSQDFGQAEALESIKWANGDPDAMLLTLQIVDGQVVSGSRTPRTTTLNMHANLTDPRTKRRVWTGQFRNRFVAPPVGKNGFDNEFVDNMLKTVLEQMAKDEIIQLPDNQAVVPKPKDGDTQKMSSS